MPYYYAIQWWLQRSSRSFGSCQWTFWRYYDLKHICRTNLILSYPIFSKFSVWAYVVILQSTSVPQATCHSNEGCSWYEKTSFVPHCHLCEIFERLSSSSCFVVLPYRRAFYTTVSTKCVCTLLKLLAKIILQLAMSLHYSSVDSYWK